MGTTILGGQAINQWTYIKTVTCASQTSIDTGAELPAYDEYWIHGYLELISTAITGLTVICNNDTGAKYAGTLVSATAVGTYSSATSANLCNLGLTGRSIMDIFIGGKTAAVANGQLSGYVLAGHPSEPLSVFFWNGGNAVQLTSLYITASAGRTFSGRLEIYGRMYK